MSENAGGKPLMGVTSPRIATPPLRTISRRTSEGYALTDWAAENMPWTLLPHQAHVLKRMLETKPDGGLRFRVCLLLAGRQGGCKTTTAMAMLLWRMYSEPGLMAVTTSAQRDSSREFFLRTVDLIASRDELDHEVTSVRRANGQESITLRNGSRLKVVATSDRAARGLSVDLLIADELRTHPDFTAWAGMSPTTIARPRGQILALSNAGTDESVVLNQLRASAIAGTDPGLGIWEFSWPDGADLDDERAWCQSLPALGRLVSVESVRSALVTTPPALFRSEYGNQRVTSLDSLIDLDAWDQQGDQQGTFESSRARVCCALDASPDGQHVTLAVAAVQSDGRCRVEIAGAWESTQAARIELGPLLARIKPRSLTVPPGPAMAALGTELRRAKARVLTAGELAEACGALVEQIASHRVLHNHDPLLLGHLTNARRVPSGTGFRFGSNVGQHVDGAYAAALAIAGARAQPRNGSLRIVTAAVDLADIA